MTDSETLAEILALVAAERTARDSPRWKAAFEEALEAHEAVVCALFHALHAALDRSTGVVPAKAPAVDPYRAAEKAVTKRLRDALPGMIAQALSDGDYP